MQVGVQHPVVAHKTYFLAEGGEHRLKRRRAAGGPAKLQRLAGREQLDAQQLLGVVEHAAGFGGGVGPHAHVVFLAVAAHDGVHRSGRAQLLVLAHDAGCGVLRNHQARVQARLGHQIGRQAALARNQLVGSSLRDAAQLGHGQGQVVEGQGQRLAVEVAAAQNQVFVGEDVGVVGHGVALGFDHLGHVG